MGIIVNIMESISVFRLIAVLILLPRHSISLHQKSVNRKLKIDDKQA